MGSSFFRRLDGTHFQAQARREPRSGPHYLRTGRLRKGYCGRLSARVTDAASFVLELPGAVALTGARHAGQSILADLVQSRSGLLGGALFASL